MAELTVEQVQSTDSLTDSVPQTLSKILKGTRQAAEDDNGPIFQQELDSTLALCHSSEYVKNQTQAEILLARFENYLGTIQHQSFVYRIQTSETFPTVWTRMTYQLTRSIAILGLKFPFLLPEATESIESFISEFDKGTGLHAYFCLIGWLEAVIEQIDAVTPKLINSLLALYNVEFYNEIEAAVESASNAEDIDLVASFTDSKNEFSALLFIKLLGQLCTEYFKRLVHAKKDISLTEHLLTSDSVAYNIGSDSKSLIKNMITSYSRCTEYLNSASDKIIKSTAPRRYLTNEIRAVVIDLTTFGYVASVVEFEQASSYVNEYMRSLSKLRNTSSDFILEQVNSKLITSIFAAGAILSESDGKLGLLLNKYFPTILSYPILDENMVKLLSMSLTFSLKSLSEDEVVSSIYSLTNLLPESSTSTDSDQDSQKSSKTQESLTLEAQEIVCRNVVRAILEISRSFKDESINVLIVTLLSQKIRQKSEEYDCVLMEGLVEFVDVMQKREFAVILRFFYDAASNSSKPAVSRLVENVWIKLSEKLSQYPDRELYSIYLRGMLSAIISKGDLDDMEHHRSNTDVAASALQIETFLKPLAYLLPEVSEKPRISTDKRIVSYFRDAWFNLCIHGFAYNSELFHKNYDSLRRIAHSSPVLASEKSWNRSETSIELNTVLRRPTSKRTEKFNKESLSAILTPGTIDSKVFETQISRPGLMFLSADLLVEMLRVDCGNCSTCLEYLSDPSVAIAKLDTFVGAIAYYCCSQYIKRLKAGGSAQFSVTRVTKQLQRIFIYCCHRDRTLQNVALQCAEKLVTEVPSALCHERSAFALLDILTLLYESIIDADTHEYEPNIEFTSQTMHIHLSLSDSYHWRQQTFEEFLNYSRKNISLAMSQCEQDMKSILYAYVGKVNTGSSSMKYGAAIALEMAAQKIPTEKEYYELGSTNFDGLKISAGGHLPKYSTKQLIFQQIPDQESFTKCSVVKHLKKDASSFYAKANSDDGHVTFKEFESLMRRIREAITVLPDLDGELIRWAGDLPFSALSAANSEFAIDQWLGIMKDNPEASPILLSEILLEFERSVKLGLGLFSRYYDISDPSLYSMKYLPTKRENFVHSEKVAEMNIRPHLNLIRLLTSHFLSCRYESSHTLEMFTEMIFISLKGLKSASTHPYSRLARFELIKFAVDVLRSHVSLKSSIASTLINTILDAALSWFVYRGRPPLGSNKLRSKADYAVMVEVARYFYNVTFRTRSQEQKRNILLMFLDDEISFLASWLTPLGYKDVSGTYCKFKFDSKVLNDAFFIDGRMAVNLFERYGGDSMSLKDSMRFLVKRHPFKVIDDPRAITFITSRNGSSKSQAIVVWSTASPLEAIMLFLPPCVKDPLVLQYSMRSIETFDPHQTFFYVPQIVQTLRYDSLGYIRRFILETANVSPLFAHQIIWNMSANSYKDEDSKIRDPIKTTLDDIRATMIREFSVTDREFYKREFSFFGDVTSISGKLKPYIKKSKADKKAKIDEEMAKIKLQEDVYLPSNPDGTVVGIDVKSGKPLQSHAKAPFMATFKIRRKVEEEPSNDDNNEDEDEDDSGEKYEIVDLGAIFKVGDDCRQDVLVLQLMSIFRTIWATAGLDVYVYPYRVTATAPGCGIIDVLPHSISRDMLGREAVNGLYEYFITQFGPETSPEFQKARNNFVKSMASYSIITFLLAIKDRHNGNIMYDNQGHVLHIDFGFCFDIAPGGVTFERSPFKLTKEMVSVMGGSSNTQAFKWFEELCVKGFLACRDHMNLIISAVEPMLDSGLPCFKKSTIKHLKARFVPQKSTSEAAAYMRGLVEKSYESLATKGYDEFQRLTNGIPY